MMEVVAIHLEQMRQDASTLEIFFHIFVSSPNESNNHPETFQYKQNVHFPACTGPQFKEQSV